MMECFKITDGCGGDAVWKWLVQFIPLQQLRQPSWNVKAFIRFYNHSIIMECIHIHIARFLQQVLGSDSKRWWSWSYCADNNKDIVSWHYVRGKVLRLWPYIVNCRIVFAPIVYFVWIVRVWRLLMAHFYAYPQLNRMRFKPHIEWTRTLIFNGAALFKPQCRRNFFLI